MNKLRKFLLLVFLILISFSSNAQDYFLNHTSWVCKNVPDREFSNVTVELYFYNRACFTVICRNRKTGKSSKSRGINFFVKEDSLVLVQLGISIKKYKYQLVDDSIFCIEFPTNHSTIFYKSNLKLECTLCNITGKCHRCHGNGVRKIDNALHLCNLCNGDRKCYACKGTGYCDL